jgi:hypothetical protein
MHLDRSRVERERLDLDPHDLLRLQLLEYLIENPILGPAIHPSGAANLALGKPATSS